MLTITLSKLIEKMVSMRIRSFLGSLIRYSIRLGNETRMTYETTSAVQGFVNPSYMMLGKTEITRDINHGYWEPKRTLEFWEVIP